ncbi:hypothetical protein CXF68_06580 [Tenacibaculum sp. Bg11-29]|uniref:hypothetical protein n=1 Tax=Tenacibaculum sp. Bg11-29 TaxID=2058306 RepID=UPI000C329655|nr:hypothetical protein [Tenacibaculum sp. Bg11-29]PKH50387.1 hypothetical protein CXF68_06580 [Tenacibaculum sp. Bg11-29]
MKKVFPFLSFILALVIVSCSSDNNDIISISSLNSITSFKINFDGVSDEDVTYDLGNDITVSVPYKTNITGIVPTITVSDKAVVTPTSGESVNFMDGVIMPFTVTAENGDKKVYNVTINIRGEVGSGSKIKVYHFKDDFSENITTFSYDDTSNFVKAYSIEEGGNTTEYTYVYNDKNQVLEKKSDTRSIVYIYNDEGLIISAGQKDEGNDTFSYTYTYDVNNRLEKLERVNKENDKVTNTSYIYDDLGNVKSVTIGAQTLENTYDDKNNPFKGIYPASYAKINIGVGLGEVNINNPSQGSFSSDTPITFTYNTDNYPLTASYVVFGFINTNVAYTYYE